MSFTREELEEMYKEQLIRLAGYYSIKLDMRMLKGDMIDKILEETSPVVEAEEPPASVRVQRIRESQE